MMKNRTISRISIILLISIMMFSCKKEEIPAPVANFSADATDVYTGVEVQFTDQSTNTPTSWAWTFGDQGTSTEQNPSHTYTEAGSYTVSMTATNGGGSNTATKTDYITVTVELTEAEKLVAFIEDPTSPAANYANTAMPATKTADHIRSLQLLQKVYIIDVRSAADYDAAHIEGAVNIGASDVLTHIEGIDLSPFNEVSIVSSTGQTAAWVTSLLRLLGYEQVFSLEWGMSSWNATFSGSWNNNTGNSRAVQFVTTASPAKATEGDMPTINTGGATPQDILEARVEAVFAEGFEAAKTTHTEVYSALSNFYIVNYWPVDHYTGMGHIEGAVQYTPKADLASTTYLKSLPTDKTVVVYCYTGQTSANMAAYLRVLGYDAKSMVFGANGMIYDEMTAGKWNGAAAPDGQVFDYPTVPTTK